MALVAGLCIFAAEARATIQALARKLPILAHLRERASKYYVIILQIAFLHLNDFGASNPFDFLGQKALRSQEYNALVAVFQYPKSWILYNFHFRA